MNQKSRPDATLSGITPEQADQLFDLLRASPYYVAAKWIDEQWHLTVSVSALRRWWSRESAIRSRANLRNAIKASEQFDKSLDARKLDERASNALRAAFWGAVTTNDTAAIKRLGELVLAYNADARDTEKLQRLLKAEQDLAAAREENAALTARIAALEASLTEAGKTTAADPAAVSAALDKHLGVSK